MKSNINLLLSLFIFLFIGLTACSSDDDDNNIIDSGTSGLVLSEDSVELFLDEQNEVTLDIESGAGNYDIFSLNANIATAQLVDNKIKIKGINRGSVSIIILDNKAQLKYVNVDVLYKNITLDEDDIVLEYPKGQIITMTIPIIKGNGNYTAKIDNEDVITVEGTATGIKVTTKGIEGKASVLLTDALGREATLGIETKSSMEPYNKYQLDEIMNDNSTRYIFNNTQGYWEYGTLLNGMENDMNRYGWDYYNYYYLKVYFGGDKTVGSRANSKISYKMGNLNISNKDLSIFRIIKNDGEKIWMVFSYLNNETVISGLIVTDI